MTNDELNFKVAEAQGWWNADGMWMSKDDKSITTTYTPSTNWEQAGELLEKYHIELEWNGSKWIASTYSPEIEGQSISSTPQRAICLAVLEAEK